MADLKQGTTIGGNEALHTGNFNPTNFPAFVGPRGATGATGATGAQGPAGSNGTNGSNGAKGDKGDQGDRGAAGATGATGPQGPAGPAGSDGADGADGQVKIIINKSTAGTNAVTITPASFVSGSTVNIDAPGRSVILFFKDSKWNVIGGNGHVVA